MSIEISAFCEGSCINKELSVEKTNTTFIGHVHSHSHWKKVDQLTEAGVLEGGGR